MKKLALVVLLICAVIGVAYASPVRSTGVKDIQMGEMLTRAFDASQAQAEGYYVHNWSIVNQTFMTMDELAQMAQKMNSVLQIPNAQENKINGERQYVYQLYGRWDPSTEVSLALTTMNLQGQQPQTVLVIKIERDSNRVQDITQSVEKVKSTAAQIGVSPQISTCIKGFYNDRIDSMGRNQIIGRVFKAVNANEVEGIRSDSLVSVSGYSPLSKEYIKTNGKRMNLQVAVHYDAFQKKTRILVGSPIVTIEY
ncbi:YwmB family TATA-box binding protein [Effusibacillus consociatus]|uniref:YwmB family TATA-box binding protein n=1 Tax=Effusibacillus consociatus TaxID=1117041 RepID=A0ABV9Q8B8_9BACL